MVRQTEGNGNVQETVTEAQQAPSQDEETLAQIEAELQAIGEAQKVLAAAKAGIRAKKKGEDGAATLAALKRRYDALLSEALTLEAQQADLKWQAEAMRAEASTTMSLINAMGVQVAGSVRILKNGSVKYRPRKSAQGPAVGPDAGPEEPEEELSEEESL